MSVKVLVAEDDVDVRRYLEQLLRIEGYDVETAVDGGEAISKAETSAPNVVVLDVMMPVADGVTVLRRLRSCDRLANVPVILLTARADDKTTWEGWRAGCNSYIPKPFEPEHLLHEIQTLVDEAKRSRR